MPKTFKRFIPPMLTERTVRITCDGCSAEERITVLAYDIEDQNDKIVNKLTKLGWEYGFNVLCRACKVDDFNSYNFI